MPTAQQQGKRGNNGPEIKWWSDTLACGTRRQRLFVDGRETPFFIDTAKYKAHRSYGDTHGLWGAGLGKFVEAKTPYRTAGFFGNGKKIQRLKHRAEQLALAEPRP